MLLGSIFPFEVLFIRWQEGQKGACEGIKHGQAWGTDKHYHINSYSKKRHNDREKSGIFLSSEETLNLLLLKSGDMAGFESNMHTWFM